MATKLHFLDKLMQDTIAKEAEEEKKLAQIRLKQQAVRAAALLHVGNWTCNTRTGKFVFSGEADEFYYPSTNEFIAFASKTLNRPIKEVVYENTNNYSDFYDSRMIHTYYVDFASAEMDTRDSKT